MAHYKYLIVGGGMTADAAVRGIRELDATGRIALIGEDPNPPYNRPPLSKGLWKGKPLDSIWRKTEDNSVELVLRRTVKAISLSEKKVTDELGKTYTYDKLLLATGGTPRKLPFGGEDVIYFRTLDDYKKLRELCGKNLHFGVIGGGFIGSEIAAALNMNGEKVTMLLPEKGIGAKIFPEELSLFITGYYRAKGITVHTSENVVNLHKSDGSTLIQTDQGRQLTVDVVIAGIGLPPNVELARTTGLHVNNGIIVDEKLQTSHADVYAAGDVAEFNQPALQKRRRIEHEDNANTMGKQAGRNMASANETYEHLSYFYSDLFELGYEAVGELDPRMETVVDWKEPFKKGVIYYLAEQKVRGVLLWNVWNSVPAARTLIGDPGPFKAASLIGKLG